MTDHQQMNLTSRKLATLVFGLTGSAGPARAYWPALRAGQARATRRPITQLSANRPPDFYNIDTCAHSLERAGYPGL